MAKIAKGNNWGLSKKANVAIACVAGITTLGSGSTDITLKFVAVGLCACVATLSIVIQGFLDLKTTK